MRRKLKDTIPYGAMEDIIKHAVRLISTGRTPEESAVKIPAKKRGSFGKILIAAGIATKTGNSRWTKWSVVESVRKEQWKSVVEAVWHDVMPKNFVASTKVVKAKPAKVAKVTAPVVVKEQPENTTDLLLKSAFIQDSVAAILQTNSTLFMAAAEENKALQEANRKLKEDVEAAMELGREAETRMLLIAENLRGREITIGEMQKTIDQLQAVKHPSIAELEAKVAELEASNENIMLAAGEIKKQYDALVDTLNDMLAAVNRKNIPIGHNNGEPTTELKLG